MGAPGVVSALEDFEKADDGHLDNGHLDNGHLDNGHV